MDYNGKVAVVTGASSGIGKATALKLIARGFRVHAGARRIDQMADLGTAGATVHHLDLTVPESIDGFIAEILRDGGHVDVVVNNAGYGSYGAVEDVPMGDARAQMDVNLFGLARVIQLVLPSMRSRRSGRIINVTSIGGKIWAPLGAWYHASKFAVEGFSDCLRNEVRPFGIDVIVIEPAGTKTEWSGVAIESAQRVSGAGPYASILTAAAPLYMGNAGQQSSEGVADVICRAAITPRPKARYATSAAAKIIITLRWLLTDALFDGLINRLFHIPKRLPTQ
jgi:NAD(P)-dependent dehydrogenase (short-subunit alcohol dehydrogenase family)